MSSIPARLRTAVVSSVGVLTLALLGGCAAGGDPAEPATVLTIATASSSANLDPTQSATSWPGSAYAQAAYDPLIQMNSDGEYVPGLAVEWGYQDPANTIFSMTLRDGVKFSDGADLTAEGIKAWIEYYATTSGSGSGVFQNISSVDVTGPLDLTITLAKSDPQLPWELSQNRYGFPVSPDALEDPTVLESATFGTGQYVFDAADSVLGTTYTYVKNEEYWNPDAQEWDKIVITVVKDSNAALSAVQNGQVMVSTIDPQSSDAAKQAGLTLTNAPAYFNGLLIFDREGELIPALGDVRVRQALNFAVDREAIVSSVFGSWGTATPSLSDPGLESYSSDLESIYTYDPEEAKRLLDEAGYGDGFEISIGVLPLTGLEANFAQALGGYFEDIGLTVDIVQYPDLASGLTDLRSGKISLLPVTAFELTESDLLAREQQIIGSSLNPFQIEDLTLEDLYVEAGSSAGADRTAALQAIQHYLLENGNYVAVGTSDILLASSDQLAPFKVTGGNHTPVVTEFRPASAD